MGTVKLIVTIKSRAAFLLLKISLLLIFNMKNVFLQTFLFVLCESDKQNYIDNFLLFAGEIMVL